MWETFISWYLNTYLGKYFENLNSQQLSFAISQGEFELENVPLKKHIFRSWGLPIEVKSGVVGHIKIEFNILKYLRSEPVLITIRDIYIIASPLNLSEWDPIQEEALAHEVKMNSLDSHEARWKAQNDLASNSVSYYSSLYFSSMRIGASIVTKVFENLQLNVQNVHIRFEEEIGSRSRVLAFGITLESLTAESCDSNWILGAKSGNEAVSSFKILQLSKFGFYCDTKGERFNQFKPQDLKVEMDKPNQTHDYILIPVSTEVRIAKNNSANPLKNPKTPRFDVYISLDKVPIQITDSQYRNTMRTFSAYQKLKRNCRLHHYRPYGPIEGNGKEWWLYAIGSILSIRGYKRRKCLKTWNEIINRAKDNVAYVKAYEQHLLRELLSSDIQKIKDRLESELHYEEIVELRELAMKRVEKWNNQNINETGNPTGNENRETNSNSSTGALGWVFPSWYGWSSSSASAAVSPMSPMSGSESFTSLDDISFEERQSDLKFDEAILGDVKAYGRDALFARFKFILKNGSISLHKMTGHFLELDFVGFELKSEFRPRSGSKKFELSLSSVYLRDCRTRSLIISPHVNNSTSYRGNVRLASFSSQIDSTEPLFNLTYENKPQKKKGHKVWVTTKSLDLIIHPLLWEDLSRYFKFEMKEDPLEIPQNSYEAMKQRTKEELKIYWEKFINQNMGRGSNFASNWEICLDISAPQIVIHGLKPTTVKKSSSESKSAGWTTPQLVITEDSDDSYLVIDLGRFRFSNAESKYIERRDETMEIQSTNTDSISDENEEFLTPCSSPVPEIPSDEPLFNFSIPASPINTSDELKGDESVFSDNFDDLHNKLYKRYSLEIKDVQLIVVEKQNNGKDVNWKAAIVKGISNYHLVDKFSLILQFERRLVYSVDPQWPAATLVATLPKLNFHFNENKLITLRNVYDSFFKDVVGRDMKERQGIGSLWGGSQLSLYDNDSLHEMYPSDVSMSGKVENPNCILFLAEFTIESICVEIQSKGRSIAELQISGAKTSVSYRSIDTNVSFLIQSLLLADAIQTFGPDFELLLASHKHVCMDSISGSLIDSDPTSPMSLTSPTSPLPVPSPKGHNQTANATQLHDALLSSLNKEKNKSDYHRGITPESTDALITAELTLVKEDDMAILSLQFNNLDVIANQETMNEIYQFLQNILPAPQLPSPKVVRSSSTSFSNSKTANSQKLFSKSGTQISFDFNRLNVLLLRGVVGRDGHEFARKIATVTVTEARVNMMIAQDYFELDGKLGSLQIRDIGIFAGKYPLKFIFQGKQALDFDYCRKENDAKFRLQMASAVYVHTQRFYNEFWTSVYSLFGNNGQSVEDAKQNKWEKAEKEYKGFPVMLDIQAGAPVLIFPVSASSKHLFVADLGHLSVKNCFQEAKSKSLAFDTIYIELINMDLFTAEIHIGMQLPEDGQKFWKLGNDHIETIPGISELLKDKCALKLKAKRLLRAPPLHTEANLSVQGTLSTIFCALDPDKYKLIRGLLEYNIGEKIEAPQSANPSPLRQPHNVDSSHSTQHVKTTIDLAIEINLVNVTMEVIKENGDTLSRIDFIRSKFTFLNKSDGTRDVDLASQEILISDIRKHLVTIKQREMGISTKNVFTKILQQSSQGSSSAHQMKAGPSSFQSETPLQAEIHYRQTSRDAKTTIVLNNMQLMMILDWWMELLSFIKQKAPPFENENESGCEEDEGPSFMRVKIRKSLGKRSRTFSSPITVSPGIVTKRAPILDVPSVNYELKINISNCELVVVEDTSVWDSNAIILKSTAVMWYRPHLERPISCSVVDCELFSCILGLESDTALSILDPTNIQFDIVKKVKKGPPGILDATFLPSPLEHVLKIKSQHFSLRLSYCDMKMFVCLIEKFSKQAQAQLLSSSTPLEFKDADSNVLAYRKKSYFDEILIDKLVSMGFNLEASIDALEKSEWRLDDAALLLIENEQKASRIPKTEVEMETSTDSDLMEKNTDLIESGVNSICEIEVKCACFSVCVIDDCKDADVPLIELCVTSLELNQKCVENSGRLECFLNGDYYNRGLSGWEPFIEPWKCNASWKINQPGLLGECSPNAEFPKKIPEIEIAITSGKVLNLTITSTFLSLYETVKSNWTEDYESQKLDRRRAPFVPFALLNETGSPLWFSTIISNNEELVKQKNFEEKSDGTCWIEVAHGCTLPFTFEGRGKIRHRNTHQLKKHQLAIKIDGWQEIVPVSVDKVGNYFRVAKHVPFFPSNNTNYLSIELPPTRLVFEVTLSGSAQKLVRVRSALMVHNTLPEDVELKLENTISYPSFQKEQTGGSKIVKVKSGETYPIPLHSVWANIWVRPIFSKEEIKYNYSVTSLLTKTEDYHSCPPMVERAAEYCYCVAINKDEFPADGDPIIYSAMNNFDHILSKRANLVTLISPLTIINLLPHEISFKIKNKDVRNQILPGKNFCLTNVDIRESIEIFFQMENFTQGANLIVNPNNSKYISRLKVLDVNRRPLYLTAKVQKGEGNHTIVTISCPYWIVNKSGIPVICKQEGSVEAAGQFEEHEVGRMITPLLFTFPDEGGTAITLRLGNKLHRNTSKAQWCRSFHPQNGIIVRKLLVNLTSPKKELTYLVGIEIKNGKGKYRNSKMITIASRIIIDNHSNLAMEISQKYFASSFLDPSAEETHLILPPGCNLPFHWPRLDKEQVLCVRLIGEKHSLWSGGFVIENVDSFQINIRDIDGKCTLLRVEIVHQGPTYFIVFNNIDELPPPFIIDNRSLVAVSFNQTCISEERFKIKCRPESITPYAWDEPMMPHNLTLTTGGASSVVVSMDQLGYSSTLAYENFHYIAFSATFPKNGSTLGRSGTETLEMVLDVPEGTKVVVRKKQQGSRSQLWRIHEDGLIEHEGSSPPRDFRKPSKLGSHLVLDIAGSGPIPSQFVHLMLRPVDKRRTFTQHWEFTNEGRLKCIKYENLFVQAKDGFNVKGKENPKDYNEPASGSWNMWNDVMLGPPGPICYTRTDTGIPVEQAVEKQKLRPGSGRIALRVDTEGPTGVLRIVDVERPFKGTTNFEVDPNNLAFKKVITVYLRDGLGISIVSCNPREELIYAKFLRISLKWKESKISEILEASVDKLQIDNQIHEAEKTAVVYMIPTREFYSTDDDVTPALLLSWNRMKTNLNAEVSKSFELSIKPLNVILEERLLIKLAIWCGFTKRIESQENVQESDFEVQKALVNATSLKLKRYYFGILKIELNQVRLSVLTSSKLTPDLSIAKRRLGLTLIQFEDAAVELDPFIKYHPFETFDILSANLVKHFRDELLSQAAIILGSIDFLGNPLGFVNDVSVGVSNLIYDGSIGSLVKNVTHGLSNSAAKVTGSLGDGLGRTTMDDKHEEERRKIREEGTSGHQFYAGVRGLGHGLLGGVTSIFAQSFEGAAVDGVPGFISGLGKGIVGTVTKPAIGILDLATGTAAAIRDSSKSSAKMIPGRIRPIRVPIGNGGLLPVYSDNAAKGQVILYDVNGRNFSEIFIACEVAKGDEAWIVVSSEAVTVFKPKSYNTLLKITLSHLMECQLVNTDPYNSQLAIEFVKRPDADDLGSYKPQVLCDSEAVGKRVVQQVNYAKLLYEEMRHSQIMKSTSPYED